MIWSRALVCFTAVISLLLGAIWPNTAAAAVAPTIVPLGSITDGLTVPGELDVDAAGNLYVADIKGQKVLKYDAFGGLLRTYEAVAVTGQGLAVTPDGSRIYVATSANVSVLDGATGAASELVALSSAGEIDLDAAGNVYVVDVATLEVKVFSASGVSLSVYPRTISTRGRCKRSSHARSLFGPSSRISVAAEPWSWGAQMDT